MIERDDDLRARIAALDPMRPSAVPEPLPRARAEQILEAAMTRVDETRADETRQTPTRRRPLLLAAAAAAVLVVGGGVAAALAGGGDPPTTAGGSTPSTLELNLPAPDVSASCIEFRVEYLADMPTAFAGTVTAISDDAVTFEVDRWYAGGAADLVTVAKVDPNTSAALDGVTFEADERYLVTASESGTLNGCGFSGPATADLEAAFAEAFPD